MWHACYGAMSIVGRTVAYHVGTGGTVSGSHTSQRTGLRPKAVTGATPVLSFTFLQKVWEAGSNSCVMGWAVSRKSLQQSLSPKIFCLQLVMQNVMMTAVSFATRSCHCTSHAG